MILSLSVSSFHDSSYYAKMSMGVNIKEDKNVESKFKGDKLEKERQIEWTL